MDEVLGWLGAAYDSMPLLFWVVGSLGAYALATNLIWPFRTRRFWRSPYSRWLVEGGRFFFYLGIPYLALGGWPRQPFQGLVSPEDLGLIVPGPRWPAARWLETAGTGLGLGLVALLILGLAWAGANRRQAGGGLRFAPRPWWHLLVAGVYLEAHWTFWRGALTLVLDDFYGGVFGGLGLVYLAWGMNPAWRRGWRQAGRAANQWLCAAQALVSALIFFLTQNFWVCLGVHWLLSAAFRLATSHIDPQQAGRNDLGVEASPWERESP